MSEERPHHSLGYSPSVGAPARNPFDPPSYSRSGFSSSSDLFPQDNEKAPGVTGHSPSEGIQDVLRSVEERADEMLEQAAANLERVVALVDARVASLRDREHEPILPSTTAPSRGLNIGVVGATLLLLSTKRAQRSRVLEALAISGVSYWAARFLFKEFAETFDSPDRSADSPWGRRDRLLSGVAEQDNFLGVAGGPRSSHRNYGEGHSQRSLVDWEMLMNELYRALVRSVPGEKFIPAEAQGVLQGLVHSLRSAILMNAKEQARGLPLAQAVVTFETTDGFCSARVDRNEIEACIQDASGISAKAAQVALMWLERYVRARLVQTDVIDVDHIGRVRVSGRGFRIELAPELQIHPRSLAAA